MKKKSFFYVAALAVAMVACENKPSFEVVGEVTGADNSMLYLEHNSINGVVTLDSMKLDESGTFSFSQESPAAPDFYRLRIDNKMINFVVDSTETVNVKTSFDGFAVNYDIDSEDNKKIKELSLLQCDLQNGVNALAKSGMPAGIVRDSIFSLIGQYKENVKRNYIFKSPNRPFAYFALFQQLNGMMLFDPLTDRDDVKCFAAVATSLNTNYPDAERTKNIYNMVMKGMKNTRPTSVKPLEISPDKIRESTIIDIPLRDIRGNEMHLTELKGKVVLIDFTVYGNAEMGARNLALRELYNKYSKDGLEIYQISLDPNEHFWKTAAGNLPWICVRDPKGAYSTYVRLYGVSQLPTSFLVNRANELCLRADEKTDIEAEIKKLL